MCFLPRDDILKQLKFAQEKEDGKLRMDLEQTKKFKVNDLDLPYVPTTISKRKQERKMSENPVINTVLKTSNVHI